MKKCDFHIHTVPTISDADFVFSMDVLKGYVDKMALNVIAITNHNLFDMGNYMSIKEALSPNVDVLPGIEVNLEGGHILVISNQDDAEIFDFNNRCEAVNQRIKDANDSLTIEDFHSFFPNLNKYVLIPHYDKSPQLPKEVINSLGEFIAAGEVTSVKKFLYMQKDIHETLTPVLFSDFRCSETVDEKKYPVRHTYLDVNEINTNSLNLCLRDKAKVTLTEADGNKLFCVFSDGQMLSTGLNIMYGRRSTGKTWTLNQIAAIFGERAKYIKQFELQNFGKDYTSEQFETDQKARLEGIVNSFFSPFKDVVEDVAQMPTLLSDDTEVDTYLKALIKRSEMENIKDVYSNSTLYDEIPYSVGGTKQLRSVISAVVTLLDPNQYQDLITAHIQTDNLRSLLKVLIERLRAIEFSIKCRNLSNDILNDVKSALQMQTALPAIPDIDFYEISKRQFKREKFDRIVNDIKQDRIIYQETMHRFKIILRTRVYDNASDVKAGQGISQSLVDAYSNYNNPLSYLKKLIDLGIDTSKLHRLFVAVQYNILNENGYKVSGGEQSEFTFLQKIKDARTKDILLIDEPESSFDNMFLKKDINNFLKGISEEMPVVISTHNNTIGGSISPDYILYTEKVIEDGEAKYKRYSGYATDTSLRTVEGDEIENYQITIDSLEAGEEAYQERNTLYGILRNQ